MLSKVDVIATSVAIGVLEMRRVGQQRSDTSL